MVATHMDGLLLKELKIDSFDNAVLLCLYETCTSSYVYLLASIKLYD